MTIFLAVCYASQFVDYKNSILLRSQIPILRRTSSFGIKHVLSVSILFVYWCVFSMFVFIYVYRHIYVASCSCSGSS